MAQYTVKTRVQLKYDTEANWNKARGFVPLRGEVIIYATDDLAAFCRLKVGDGETPVIDLPFIPFGDGGEGGNANIVSHTTAYWSAHASYLPNAGEIIIYSDYTEIEPNIFQPSIKIGDGTTYVADLPFIDEMMQYHMNNAAIHVTPEEKEFWNNKLNCNDIVQNETLQLNRR